MSLSFSLSINRAGDPMMGNGKVLQINLNISQCDYSSPSAPALLDAAPA